ncbi:MAG: hypothetical protein KGZ72_06525, partial [Roseovarius sp.]|nr:hypothetical protein [Roseovarius sp.]
MDFGDDNDAELAHELVVVHASERAVVDDGLNAAIGSGHDRAEQPHGGVGLPAGLFDAVDAENDAPVWLGSADAGQHDVGAPVRTFVVVVLCTVGVGPPGGVGAVQGPDDGPVAVDGPRR